MLTDGEWLSNLIIALLSSDDGGTPGRSFAGCWTQRSSELHI
jgi:hypothetical protein